MLFTLKIVLKCQTLIKINHHFVWTMDSIYKKCYSSGDSEGDISDKLLYKREFSYILNPNRASCTRKCKHYFVDNCRVSKAWPFTVGRLSWPNDSIKINTLLHASMLPVSTGRSAAAIMLSRRCYRVYSSLHCAKPRINTWNVLR